MKGSEKMALIVKLYDKASRDKFFLMYDKIYLATLFSVLGLYFLWPYID
jgi:hypothetical protein